MSNIIPEAFPVLDSFSGSFLNRRDQQVAPESKLPAVDVPSGRGKL
jgi:hypothetical protein